MSQILGTDGMYDARSMPTIVRGPYSHQEAESRFYVTLLAALLFSDGFHLDAAWLVHPRLNSLIMMEESSMRQLLAKGYIRLVSRIPREDMLAQLKDNSSVKTFAKRLSVWEWPAAKVKPCRHTMTENSEWIIFGSPEPSATIVTTSKALEPSVNIRDWFVTVDPERTKVHPNSEFWATVDIIGVSKIEPQLDATELDKILLVTTRNVFEHLVSKPQLSTVLGNSSAVAIARNELCRSMLSELIRAENGNISDSLQKISQQAEEIAKLCGVGLCDQTTPHRIAISLRDIIGFLLCWQERGIIKSHVLEV